MAQDNTARQAQTADAAQLLEEELRAEIRALVKKYYTLCHAPKQKRPFVPDQSFINYAGRIYDDREMTKLLDSCLDFQLTTFRFAKQLETDLSKWLGIKYTMLVNSGSSANLLAFSALTSPQLGERQVRRGDEVITVAAGFPTTVAPIIQYGAKPVFLDVELANGTYNIDVSLLQEALSSRTKAVMIAHTLGNPFDVHAVKSFCKENKLWLIEDNCDALGSTYDGKLTGTFGDLATSSFYPAHHITTGEGGAVYTSSGRLKRIAESIRDWGRDCWCEPAKDNTCGKRFAWKLGELPLGYDHKYTYSHFGYNLKLTDMQAAIGCAQLEKLDEFVTARKTNWQRLRAGLDALGDTFILPNPTELSDPSWFGFILTLRENCGFTREEMTSYLESRGIQTRVLFAGNLLRHPLFNHIRNDKDAYRVVGDLKNTDRILTDTFWIGVYPGITKAMCEFMVDAITDFVKKRKKATKRP